ncbi:3-hydroxyacyl-ACP dehydratase [Enterovibrio makurazakiensis]|uniref:ApeI family dehydratase n=1 Tax=Enterovibrio makurazakiensis TaxID=2910232 RepID=UPI003D1EC137
MQRKPTLVSVELNEDSASLKLKMDHTLEDFKGHFPQYPILPGVTQIALAVQYAREYFGLSGSFGGMEVIKFQEPILPDMVVTLSLTWHAEKQKLYFRYDSDKSTHSSGRMMLSEHA